MIKMNVSYKYRNELNREKYFLFNLQYFFVLFDKMCIEYFIIRDILFLHLD